MVEARNRFILCLDDSGTRNPTRKMGKVPSHGYDWFALGGVIFREADEQEIRDLHEKFCSNWDIDFPLHSSEIRAKANKFSFIGRLSKEDELRFYEELYQMMRSMPVLGTACVIDRPCYNDRYLEKYDPSKRWQLCKSAFSIVVERSAKFAIHHNAKLRIYIERGDKITDRTIKSYYDEIRSDGMPFAQATSSKYDPITADIFKDTLYEFRAKNKSSPLLQMADLFLWPICMGGYNDKCRPYARLSEDKKLLESALSPEQISTMGTKYYCFDKK